MPKLIKGLHHVSLKTCEQAEYETTIHFYRDILGLDVIRTWNNGSFIMLNAGNAIVEISNNADTDLPQGAVRHFAFETESVDNCVAVLRAEGYPITVEPKNVDLAPDPDHPYPARIAFCIGPVGEEIEFFQPLS